MSNFDDLFDKQVEKRKNFQEPKMDNFNQEINKQSKNGVLFLIYIIVSIVFSFGGLFYFSSVYPSSVDIINDIEIVNTPTLTTVYDGDTIVGSNVSIQYINNSDTYIYQSSVIIEFYDVDENLIESFIFDGGSIAAGETNTINETITIDYEPTNYAVLFSIDLSAMFYIILGALQAFVLSIFFIFVDKLAFKTNWKEFKLNPKKYLGQIFTGYFILFASLLLASIILEYLGVNETSQNEATIRGYFEKDTFRLIVLFFMLCIFTPIVEEVIFRKVVYNFIEPKASKIVAIIGTGVVFGLMHVITYGDFIQSIPYILMGIALGYVYYRSNKNIYVSIGAHFLNNFVTYVMYVLVLYGYYSI